MKEILLILLLIHVVPIHTETSVIEILSIEDTTNSSNYYWMDGKMLNIISIHFSFSGSDYFAADDEQIEKHTMGDLFIVINGEVSKLRGCEVVDDHFLTHAVVREGRSVISLVYAMRENIDYDTAYIFINMEVTTKTEKLHTEIEFIDTYTDGVDSFDFFDNSFKSDLTVNLVDWCGLISYNSYGSLSTVDSNSFYRRIGFVFISDASGIHPVDEPIYYYGEKQFHLLVFHKAGVVLGDDPEGIDLTQTSAALQYQLDSYRIITGNYTYSNSAEMKQGNLSSSQQLPSSHDTAVFFFPIWVLIVWRRRR